VNHLRKVIYLCGLTVLVALLSTEFASAGTITVFSNLGGGFEGGGFVIGQEPPAGGGNEVIAHSFVPSTTVDFADSILALQNVFGSGPLAVHLESDNSGVPGTILDTPTQVGTISMSPGEVTFTCTTCPLIDAGCIGAQHLGVQPQHVSPGLAFETDRFGATLRAEDRRLAVRIGELELCFCLAVRPGHRLLRLEADAVDVFSAATASTAASTEARKLSE
jgi:hypothetical protein